MPTSLLKLFLISLLIFSPNCLKDWSISCLLSQLLLNLLEPAYTSPTSIDNVLRKITEGLSLFTIFILITPKPITPAQISSKPQIDT